jgi:hypothetical protein
LQAEEEERERGGPAWPKEKRGEGTGV